MITRDRIAILGAGGHARETYWHLKDCLPEAALVFVDDLTTTEHLDMGGEGIRVVKDWRFGSSLGESFTHFVVGVGAPAAKRAMVAKALESGLTPLPTLVHPRAYVQGIDCALGTGGMITPGCVLTTNVRLGDFVLLNLNTTVAHDAVIGDYATCAAGCRISGNVTLGKDVSLGAGTVIREKRCVAAGVVTGAQACIVKDITEAGITVAGVPAKRL